MGGSRNGKSKLYLNLVLTMGVAGLWHGASLNFILWGILNGLFLCIEKSLKNLFYVPKIIRIFLNCFLVFNLWLVFRITDFEKMINFFKILYYDLYGVFSLNNFLIFLMVILSVFSQKYDNYEKIKIFSKNLKLSILLPILIIVLATGFGISTGTSEKFIYFDF